MQPEKRMYSNVENLKVKIQTKYSKFETCKTLDAMGYLECIGFSETQIQEFYDLYYMLHNSSINSLSFKINNADIQITC